MDPVVHFEMPYENKQRMADFYAKAFGWKANMLGPEMGEYVVMMTVPDADEKGYPTKPGMINGGFYKKPKDPLGQAPSVVISVENIDEAMKKITASGGKLLGEAIDIPGVGKYASFTDTEGNRVSVMQANPMN